MRYIFILLLITSFFAHTVHAQKGTIAYVHDGTEIRLIDPDGANDRKLWTHPDLKKALGIDSLAWRPDGKELAFSSRHAAAASLYDADLYAIRPDGSGLRKLTNAPQMSEFARFPNGNVSVTFRNASETLLAWSTGWYPHPVRILAARPRNRSSSSTTRIVAGIGHSFTIERPRTL
jgi:hypothetical protein